MVGQANKKAQAAIEFLTTYGWAILVLVVVLIAMGWLGIFNIQQQVPDQCRFPVGTITCKDVRVTWDGTNVKLASLTIRNDYNRMINICEAACSAEKQNEDGTVGYPVKHLSLNLCNVNGINIAPGEERTIDLSLSGGSSSVKCWDAMGRSDGYKTGSRYSGKIYLTDAPPSGVGAVRIITGDLVATVQPG
jgi:hypothetical protein